jgi:hypothetical protein
VVPLISAVVSRRRRRRRLFFVSCVLSGYYDIQLFLFVFSGLLFLVTQYDEATEH